MSATVRHFVGNTSPPLSYTVKAADASGAIVPYPFPAGTSATFFLRESSGAYRVNGAPATIMNPAADDPADADAGRLRYTWQVGDVAAPAGEMVGWFRIAFAGGASQDTPSFIFLLEEHSDSVLVGAYTSPALLKDFTGFDSLKLADNTFLSTNVIPRAEAWLAGFGPFLSATCPQLKLAANMLAEAIFLRINPTGANAAMANGFKSESIGDYSYTLNDVAAANGGIGPWEELLREVEAVLAPCIDYSATTLEVISGSEGSVFEVIPSYLINGQQVGIDVTLEASSIWGWRHGAWYSWRRS